MLTVLTKQIVIFLLILQAKWSYGDYGEIAGEWKVRYNTDKLRVQGYEEFNIRIYDVDLSTTEDFYFEIKSEDENLAQCFQIVRRNELEVSMENPLLREYNGTVPVTGSHYGYTRILVTLQGEDNKTELSQDQLLVAVLRLNPVDTKVLSLVAAGLVLLMFMNLGTVLDLKRLKGIMLRPLGPFLGFCSRYMIMPSLALGVGVCCFPGQEALQLALFFTGLAPSGGIANICNVFLKGNLNLSIAITTINSLMAMGMMPFWFYVVARVIFNDDNLKVPFVDLALSASAVMIALAVGISLRTFIPKTTIFIFRFLKPLSIFLSLCLIGVTVGINAFVFKNLTGMIVLAAFILPLVGYVMSFGLARMTCQSRTDSLTVGIEASVLNMTVPVVLIQNAVEQPKSDLILVVPITCALMSLVLVLFLYCVRRLCGWNVKVDDHAFDHKELIIAKT